MEQVDLVGESDQTLLTSTLKEHPPSTETTEDNMLTNTEKDPSSSQDSMRNSPLTVVEMVQHEESHPHCRQNNGGSHTVDGSGDAISDLLMKPNDDGAGDETEKCTNNLMCADGVETSTSVDATEETLPEKNDLQHEQNGVLTFGESVAPDDPEMNESHKNISQEKHSNDRAENLSKISNSSTLDTKNTEKSSIPDEISCNAKKMTLTSSIEKLIDTVVLTPKNPIAAKSKNIDAVSGQAAIQDEDQDISILKNLLGTDTVAEKHQSTDKPVDSCNPGDLKRRGKPASEDILPLEPTDVDLDSTVSFGDSTQENGSQVVNDPPSSDDTEVDRSLVIDLDDTMDADEGPDDPVGSTEATAENQNNEQADSNSRSKNLEADDDDLLITGFQVSNAKDTSSSSTVKDKPRLSDDESDLNIKIAHTTSLHEFVHQPIIEKYKPSASTTNKTIKTGASQDKGTLSNKANVQTEKVMTSESETCLLRKLVSASTVLSNNSSQNQSVLSPNPGVQAFFTTSVSAPNEKSSREVIVDITPTILVSPVSKAAAEMPKILEVFGGVTDQTLTQLHSGGPVKDAKVTAPPPKPMAVDNVPRPSLKEMGKTEATAINLEEYVMKPQDMILTIKPEPSDSGYSTSSVPPVINRAKKTTNHQSNWKKGQQILPYATTVSTGFIRSIAPNSSVITQMTTLANARNALTRSLRASTPKAATQSKIIKTVLPRSSTVQSKGPTIIVRSPVRQNLMQLSSGPGKTYVLSNNVIRPASGQQSLLMNPSKSTLQGRIQVNLPTLSMGSAVKQVPQTGNNVSLVSSTSTTKSVVVATKFGPLTTNSIKTVTTPAVSGSVIDKEPAESTDENKEAKISDYDKMNSFLFKSKPTTKLQYTPPKPDQSLKFKPDHSEPSFLCRGCQSQFMSKPVLSEHQLRRTMCIKYECLGKPSCRVLFYNPCQLSLHLRLHPIPPNVSWKDNVEIFGLPEYVLDRGNNGMYKDSKAKAYSAANREPKDDYYGFLWDKNFGKRRKEKIEPLILKVGANTSSTTTTATETSATAPEIESVPETTSSLIITVSKSKAVNRMATGTPLAPPTLTEMNSVLEKTLPKDISQKETPVSECVFQSPLKIPGGVTPMVNTAQDSGRVLCTECGILFQSRSALSCHLKSVRHKKLYTCKICPVILHSQCALQSHIRIHKNSKPYVCPECGQVIYGSHKVFWKHLHVKCAHHIRQALYSCPKCSHTTKNSKSFIQHLFEKHVESYFKCVLCPMAFKNEDNYKTHIEKTHDERKAHGKICKCPCCDGVFSSSETLTLHLNEHHLEQSESSVVSVIYRCNACSESFPGRVACVSHMEKNHKFYFNHHHMCHICGSEFKTIVTLFNHLRVKHPELNKLDQRLTDKLREMGIIKAKTDVTDSKKTKDVDGADTKDSKELPKEEPGPTEKVKDKDKEVKVEKEDDVTKFSCHKCQTEFKEADVYQRHLAKHRFIERKRRLSSDTKDSDLVLQVKIPKLAGKAKPRQPKVFTKQVPGAPDPEPMFRCSECQKTFYMEEDLESHMKIVHQTARQYPCHLCGQTYDSEQLLKAHVAKRHEGRSTEKPFVCWICQKSNIRKDFSQGKFLTKHLITMHKIARNMIDYSQFPDEETVKKYHEKMRHKGRESEERSAEDGTHEAPQPSDVPHIKRLKLAGDTTFTCAKCSFSSETREDFLSHIAKHQTSKSIEQGLTQCKECGLMFTVIPSLKRHLLVVHKIRDFSKYMDESGVDLVSQPKETEIVLPKHTANPPPDKIKRVNGLVTPTVTKAAAKAAVEAEVAKIKDEGCLECTVCYRLYSNDAELRTHMRTHGMAFIRSKRMDV